MRNTLLLLILLVSVFVGSAAAQGGESPGRRRLPPGRTQIEIGPKLQPPNTIKVAVRYKKEYGYKSERGLFDPGPNSCGAFTITAGLDAADRQRNPILIATEPKMRDSAGFYICDYLVSDLPLNESIRLFVGLADSRILPFEAWQGGTQPQPPRGYRRVIPDGTIFVTLTEREPRASFIFEMIYDLPPLKSSKPLRP
jgi:hypothetical protein